MPRINVTQSLVPNRAKFDSYVSQILESGWFTNRGAMVRELEKRLEEYLGVKHVVLVNNATLGLQIAYRLLGLHGEVITTPFTFVATASSIKWEGLDVVFADIDRETFCIDVADIKQKITGRTSAIVPVHVFGNPCDVETIDTLAKAHNLKIIYDAAHAFAVKYKGESILNWGDVSILSFHATKLFHTIEGGALIINDDELCEHARKMINFGITGPESIECLGINAKMNEFQAAMGLCLLDSMNEVIDRRAQLTQHYDSILADILVKQRWRAGATNNQGYYPVLLPSEAMLNRVQQKLNSHDIYPRRYFYPSLDTLDFLCEGQLLPVSRDISSRILCLPIFPDMTDEQCLRIAKLVNEGLGA